MKAKDKCTVLSLILAAVTVLQAVFNPFYKALYPVFGTIFGGEGILDESVYRMHTVVVWFIALIISILAVIAAVMFYTAEDDSPEKMKYPSKLITAILLFSSVVGGIVILLFLTLSVITFFILMGQLLTLALPGLAICVTAIIFAVNINLKSGEFYGF